MIFEPGGPYTGWYLQGKLSSREGEVGFSQDENWYSKIGYDIDFLCDRAVYYSTTQRIRSRKVYDDNQIWNSDDCYVGNLAKNGSFDSWTPNYDANWISRYSAADNAWEEIHYVPELLKYCAIASTGVDNRVMVGDNYSSWRIPDGLTCANRNNNWKTGVWCPDWGLFFAFSASGLAGYACMSSPDLETWIAVATPSAADSNAWECSVFIPPVSDPDYIELSTGDYIQTLDGDIIATSGEGGFYNGRVIAFASSGTNLIMYSDDQGASWNLTTSADETASWRSGDFSPALQRIVVVAYSGQVQYSDDWGTTWNVSTAPSQKWTSVKWVDGESLWTACSEDGVQQIMTSPTGLSGSWTLHDTPYSTTTRTDSGGVASTTTQMTPSGTTYSSAATAYIADTTSLEYTVTLPALTNGHVYRINQVSGSLRASVASRTVYLKVTIQFGAGTETTVKEWATGKTSYIKCSYDTALNSDTNQTVTLRYYLKTTCGKCRAVATIFGYSVSEMTLPGSLITYTHNAWQALADSPENDLV